MRPVGAGASSSPFALPPLLAFPLALASRLEALAARPGTSGGGGGASATSGLFEGSTVPPGSEILRFDTGLGELTPKRERGEPGRSPGTTTGMSKAAAMSPRRAHD